MFVLATRGGVGGGGGNSIAKPFISGLPAGGGGVTVLGSGGSGSVVGIG